MTDDAPKQSSELILYQTEHDLTRIEYLFEGENVGLTQFQPDERATREAA